MIPTDEQITGLTKVGWIFPLAALSWGLVALVCWAIASLV